MLDLGRYQAAPRCALVFVRLGADVIKIEPPGGEESRELGPFARGQSAYWAQYNSGKRSLTLDLRAEAGRHVLEKLIAVSDVFVQNFRPGVIEEMGFGYENLRRLNPRIVMVNVSGFGRTGPLRDRIAFDQIGQAMCGYMSLNGDPAGQPVISPLPLVDRITSLHAAIAALAALYERQYSGEGQEVDVTLADAAYSTLEVQLAAYLDGGETPPRAGNLVSLGNMYACTDGHVYIADFGGDNIFPRLARAIGRDDWLQNPALVSRRGRERQSGIIEAALVEWCGDRTCEQAETQLVEAGVACARVNDIPAATHEQYFESAAPLATVSDLVAGSVHVSGNYFRFGRSRPAEIGPVPAPGQHTDEILGDLIGLAPAEIDRFRSQGIV
ncbi:MAG: CoA transferase [Chloroflexi bacterium]|nr:CoA transferase [Chloroflexota bacterium]